jgi:hypothetical protein
MSIQDVDKKFSKLNKKSKKEIEILKKWMIKMKNSTDKIKTQWEA